MKKLLYLCLLALTFSACSSSDDKEEPNPMKGTSWAFMQVTPVSIISPSEPHTTADMVAFLHAEFPDYTWEEKDFSEDRSQTTATSGWQESFNIRFASNTCTVDIDSISKDETSVIRRHYKEYYFPQGTFTGVNSTLIVTPYGMSREYTTPDGETTRDGLLSFGNGVYIGYVGSEIISKQEDTTNREHHYTFKYQMQGNDIYMSNETLTWIGKLSADGQELKVTQIVPEQKEIATFGKE